MERQIWPRYKNEFPKSQLSLDSEIVIQGDYVIIVLMNIKNRKDP